MLAGAPVAALILAGCAGEAGPGLGNDTVPTTAATTTSSTAPAETTSTVDFSRPPDQDRSSVPEEASALDLSQIVDNMRGPTRDASVQLQRLVSFADVSTPVGAQITDFAVSVTEPPADDEDGDGPMISVRVDLRAPQTVTELTDHFHDEMRSGSWFRADKTDEMVDGRERVVQIFRIPGTDKDDTELALTATAGPFSTIVIDYRSIAGADDESLERLAAWQDGLRTPGSGRRVGAAVRTADDRGTLEVRHLLTAETAIEAREDVLSLVREDEFRQGTTDGSGESAPPLLLIDELGTEYLLEFATTQDPETIELTVTTRFDLQPID